MRAPSAIYHRSHFIHLHRGMHRKTHCSTGNIDKLFAVCVHQEGKSQTNNVLPAMRSPRETTWLSRMLAALEEDPSSDLSSASITCDTSSGDLMSPSGLNGYPHTTCVFTHMYIKHKTHLRKNCLYLIVERRL